MKNLLSFETLKRNAGLIIIAIILISLDIIREEIFFTSFLVYGLFIKLLLSDLINGKSRKILWIAIWTTFIIFGGLMVYVNWFLPHGPLIDTGDVVCQGDGQGPCQDAYIEDTRMLTIPDWAKFLRTSEANLLMVGLLFAGIAIAFREEDGYKENEA